MSRIAFLTANEKRKFDAPPSFKQQEREAYFAISYSTKKMLYGLKTPINRMGFLLQLGY